MIKIKIVLLLIISFISIQNRVNAEEIDGPANLRLSPKGDIVMTLNDGIPVRIITSEGDWFQISFDPVIDRSMLAEGNIIPKNTVLKDSHGNEIGKTLAAMNVASSSEKEDKIFLTLRAYTFKDNIRRILTVEEYRIGASTEELLKKNECFDLACVPDEILLKRKKWREVSDDTQDNNSKAQDKLKKWRENRSHGDRASAKGADGKNVPLLVYSETGKTRKYKFVGLEVEKRPVEIYLDGKLLYKEEVTRYPFDEAVKKLDSHGRHWFFEFMKPVIRGDEVIKFNGTVIFDGVDLNKKYDCEEVFNFVFIRDKPFYFIVEKNGAAKIQYAGKILPLKYDSILHYACCSDGAFNPKSNDNMVWFYAMKDGALYYVEAGTY